MRLSNVIVFESSSVITLVPHWVKGGRFEARLFHESLFAIMRNPIKFSLH